MSVDPRRGGVLCGDDPRCYRQCRCSRWPDYKNRFGNYVVPHDDTVVWTPALPTGGGYLPEHWYRVELGRVWQDAGITPAASVGDPIGRLEDLTANADHVNQAVAGSKPTLQAGPNGTWAARFDGAGDYLGGAFTTGGIIAQPTTSFAVAKLDAVAVDDGNAHVIIDGDDAVNRQTVNTQTVLNPDAWGMNAGATLSGNATNSNWLIRTIVFNGAASRFWHNGVAECAAGNAGAQSIDGLMVGSNWSGAASFWDGDITEILIYAANLPNADKNQIGQYLATRCALAYTDI